MMIVLFLLALLLLLLVVFMFTIAARFRLVFNTNTLNMNLTFLWLQPLLKATVRFVEAKPVVFIYLFNKKVFKGRLETAGKKRNGVRILNSVKTEDVRIDANYGFRDPYFTGIACAAVGVASSFLNVESLRNEPDFNSDEDYIVLDAKGEMNVGLSLLNMLKAYKD